VPQRASCEIHNKVKFYHYLFYYSLIFSFSLSLSLFISFYFLFLSLFHYISLSHFTHSLYLTHHTHIYITYTQTHTHMHRNVAKMVNNLNRVLKQRETQVRQRRHGKHMMTPGATRISYCSNWALLDESCYIFYPKPSSRRWSSCFLLEPKTQKCLVKILDCSENKELLIFLVILVDILILILVLIFFS